MNPKHKGKKTNRSTRNQLRPEYDFPKMTGGVRGKYAERYNDGTNLVLLSPDVAAHFPDDRSVNATLRRVIRAGKRPVRRAR
jgi:hypothetical protein